MYAEQCYYIYPKRVPKISIQEKKSPKGAEFYVVIFETACRKGWSKLMDSEAIDGLWPIKWR